jgi:hypothetical protein
VTTLIGLALVGVSLRVKLVSARSKFNADNVVRDKLDESNQPATKPTALLAVKLIDCSGPDSSSGRRITVAPNRQPRGSKSA